MKGRIHSLESFGTVDGPGTRFVVFVQGCPMRCQYCHNPDTWDMNGGKEMTTDEILAEYEKGKEFYMNGGGLTVTGGEPLMQIDFLIELFEKAKAKGINTCLDTSGIAYKPGNTAYNEKLDRLLPLVDLVMLDIKHIDPEEHKKLCSQPNDGILAFAKLLDERHVNVWIRHVVVPGITYNREYLFRLGQFIGGLSNVTALDTLPYHDMGIVKYESLGMEYPLKGVKPLEKEEAIKARDIIIEGMKDTRKKLNKN